VIAITLPWPPRSLSPNARVHWSRKARDAKHARQVAGWCVREAGIRPGDFDIPGKLKVTWVFQEPDKRRRDDDNLISSVKAFRDGVADALGIDDSRFETTIRRGTPVKGGAVRVILEAA
jgi:crossover junction endodeoxyribonuclease RusA